MNRMIALIGMLWPVVASAQMRADSGAFVATLGTDTVAIERYVRSPTSLVIHQLTRLPESRIVDSTVRWDESGRLLGYDQLSAPVPRTGGAARVRTVATVVGDSLRIEVTQGNGVPRVRTIAADGDIPFLNLTYSIFEELVRRGRAARSPEVSLLSAGGKVTYSAVWTENEVRLTHPQSGTIRIGTDRNGRMTVYDGGETTNKVLVQPTINPDVDGLALSFAKREAGGGAIGLLSPRDTARAALPGLIIAVDYGRPAARGRVIFGKVVPYGRVWRTGANAATQLDLSSAIEVNGVEIPAGKYSLWTVPGRSEWQLIINKQTGQWGTQYDQAQDLVRIPIQTRTTRNAAERFTIDIHHENRTGTITLTWENTQAVIPFRVK